MRGMIALLAAVSVVAVLGGCAAPKSWNKANASTAERRADLSSCRKRAGVDVEARYGSGSDGLDTGGAGANFKATMRQHDAIKYGDRLVDECMRAKGYVKTRR